MEFAFCTIFLHLLLLLCSGLARDMQHDESMNKVLRLSSWDIHDDADVGRSKNAMDDDDNDLSLYAKRNYHIHDEDGQVIVQKYGTDPSRSDDEVDGKRSRSDGTRDNDLSLYGKSNHHIHDENGEIIVPKYEGGDDDGDSRRSGDDHLWIYRKQNEDHINYNHDHHAASHMMKRSEEMVFFHINDVKVGERIPIYFPRKDPMSSYHPDFLSKQQADAIPFSSDKLPHVLQMLSISTGSPQARAMKNTLAHCEAEPIQGETKTCATSLESLLDFVHALFGPHSDFNVLTTRYLKRSVSSNNIVVQNYTVVGIRGEMWPRKMIACHEMPYAYPVLYCHGLEGGSKVLKVFLGGENGDLVDAVGVCHMDTSHWSRTHASFRVLGVEPGKSPVCHFFPSYNLVILPA